MVFNSVVFLFCFLPLSLLLYYLVPGRAKNAVLLAESLIFYCWTGVAFLPLIAVLIVFNYLWALLTARAKAKLRGLLPLAAMLVNLGVLVYFKYANFLIDTVNQVAHLGLAALNIGTVLPLGISYYIFKIISYEVDVCTGKIAPEKNFITFAVYVLFFPQLIVGPIVKYREMADQLHDGANRCTPARAEHGAELFVFGLAKKVILADSIGALWTDIIGAGGVGLTNVSTPLAWLGIIAYSLQLYFDFAGYSEMSNGLAALLGFDCPANFNLPYISGSITEFWRRWHITLSGWFRDYIYIPLGGNRKGTARKYINLLATFAVSGLWHGTGLTFLIWGLLHGLYQVAGAVLEPVRAKAYALLPIRRDGKLASVWQCLFTFLLVHTAWVFFRAASVQDALYVLTAQFAGGSPGEVLAQVWGIILSGFNAKPLLAAAFAAFLAFSFAVCCALDAVRRFSRRSVQGEATPVLLGLGGWRWLCYYAFAGLIFLGFLFNNGYLTGAVSFLYANF